MRSIRAGAALSRLGAGALLAVLAACGGGGGGSSGEATASAAAGPGTFTASFTPAAIDVSTVEGNSANTPFSAALSYTGNTGLYLVAEGDDAVLLAIEGQVNGSTLQATLRLRGDLAAGAHPSTLRLHACIDTDCKTEVAGSPVSLPIRYEVKPNLQVQQQVRLHRAGSEPAPSVTLPVTVPADAGTVTMRSSGPTDVFEASFDGSAVRIGTRQVKAGDYTLTLTLQGSADARYVRTVEVRYTVDPPAGGERTFSAEPSGLSLFMQQGTSQTRRITVVRPSWTDSWDAPQLAGPDGMLALRDLGGDQYELTIDTRSLAIGHYSGSVRFSAGVTGGTQFMTLDLTVVAAFYPAATPNLVLNASSTPADLNFSTAIVTADGVRARWSAVSNAPWVRVLRASGQTGVDALELQIDPPGVGALEQVVSTSVDLSIDRPGVAPLSMPVAVGNNLPNLQRGPAVLVGDKGRLYIEGVVGNGAGVLKAGVLQVDGARLRSAQLLADPRMVGDFSVLAVDVDGAVAGQPITVRAQSPLATSTVSVAVEAPTRVPQAYLALPYGAYRPPQYAPGRDALYFAGPETVYRWAHSASAWGLTQASVPGVGDIAVRPDEQRVYAVGGTAIRGLDPQSLAVLETGAFAKDYASVAGGFDALAPTALRGLVYAADQRAIASIVWGDSGMRTRRGAYWIGSVSTNRLLAELTASPGQLDPGSGYAPGEPVQLGAGLIASANAQTVVATYPSGYLSVYQPVRRVWVAGPTVPAGVTIAAVSDSGERMVRSDGVLLGAGVEIGSLASVVPFTHLAGGFGLTQDGRYGLVYGYRIATETGGERAREATLWVVDVSRAPTTPIGASTLVAALPLADAVGCTGALTTGESCRHRASVTAAPGGGSAFVLGPRGVIAVPMPAGVVVQPSAASGQRAAASVVPAGSSVLRAVGGMPATR
jgi:hypothetical protein